jgi:hypothetical protein
MTRFQAVFRKSGLAEKMMGGKCKICENPGPYSTREHLIIALVGILYETFAELERAENGCKGILVSFSVYNFIQFIENQLEPEDFMNNPKRPRRLYCLEKWPCLSEML